MDDVEPPKVAQVRALVLGRWAKNLKPGDHVLQRRAPCSCTWVTVNGQVVDHADCKRHAAQLRARGE